MNKFYNFMLKIFYPEKVSSSIENSNTGEPVLSQEEIEKLPISYELCRMSSLKDTVITNPSDGKLYRYGRVYTVFPTPTAKMGLQVHKFPDSLPKSCECIVVTDKRYYTAAKFNHEKNKWVFPPYTDKHSVGKVIGFIDFDDFIPVFHESGI